MAAKEHSFSRYADVVAALADPALAPIPPRESADAPAAPGTAGWLRATVARFASGPAHRRRRELIEADLDDLDPARLRIAAARAAARAARIGGAPADARLLAVRVLAEALGLPDPDAVAADVLLVAGVYFGGDDEAADAAVARLMAVLLSADEPLLPGAMKGLEDVEGETEIDDDAPHGPASARLEAAANRIGLLVQACDATGRLVGNALLALRADGGRHGIEAILAETVRHDPPVRVMRRIAQRPTQIGGVGVAAGDTVTLDIAAANRDPEVFTHPDAFEPHRTTPSLTFGSEPRRCPGRHHAYALAAGILDHSRTLDMARGLGSTELDEVA